MPSVPRNLPLPRSQQRKRQQYRESSAQRGYGYKWQQQRRLFLLQQGNEMCAICGRAAATEVDHIIAPSTAGHGTPDYWRLFWDWSNWQAACKPCNSRKGDR